MPAREAKVFLIAGESSGDFLGVNLMKALRVMLHDTVHFTGVGGELMQAAGLESLFPQRDIAHMGIFEVLCHLPLILRRMQQTKNAVRQIMPDIVVTIDAPDFTLRVAKSARKLGIPVVHYVAPTVWAWRPKRAEKLARRIDHLMTLLPFEPPYFTKHGLPTTFVGHPLIETAAAKGDAQLFRKQHNIEHSAPIIAVLPGSRMGEVRKLLPIFAQTMTILAKLHPNLILVVPTVDTVASEVKAAVTTWPLRVIIVRGEAEKYNSFAACTAALACSGTVSLELAIAGVPSVIAYKANPITAWLVRRLVNVRFASLVNILNDRSIIPEFLQDNCTAQNLAHAVGELLENNAVRAQQKAAISSVAGMLGGEEIVPSMRAAEVIRNMITKGAYVDHADFSVSDSGQDNRLL